MIENPLTLESKVPRYLRRHLRYLEELNGNAAHLLTTFDNVVIGGYSLEKDQHYRQNTLLNLEILASGGEEGKDKQEGVVDKNSHTFNRYFRGEREIVDKIAEGLLSLAILGLPNYPAGNKSLSKKLLSEFYELSKEYPELRERFLYGIRRELLNVQRSIEYNLDIIANIRQRVGDNFGKDSDGMSKLIQSTYVDLFKYHLRAYMEIYRAMLNIAEIETSPKIIKFKKKG